MSKEEILKAIEALSAEDQQAIRTALSDRAAASCCSSDEMQQHMGAVMKMMQSSENPMGHCREMMEMCQKMMQQKTSPTGEAAPSDA